MEVGGVCVWRGSVCELKDSIHTVHPLIHRLVVQTIANN